MHRENYIDDGEENLEENTIVRHSDIAGTSKKKLYVGLFITLVSLVATLGSLYFSELRDFIPCKLCWYQRILMYPMVWITLISLFVSKDYKYYYTTLLMSSIGLFVSSYHIYLQFFGPQSDVCMGGISCNIKYIQWLGFITIPVLSFTAFLLIFIASITCYFVGRKK